MIRADRPETQDPDADPVDLPDRIRRKQACAALPVKGISVDDVESDGGGLLKQVVDAVIELPIPRNHDVETHPFHHLQIRASAGAGGDGVAVGEDVS